MSLPMDVLRRLGANLSSGVRAGVARAALARRPAWVRVRLAPPLDETKPPQLPFVPGPAPQSLLEVLTTLDGAGRDPDVEGILLKLGGAPADLAGALAVRRAVEAAARTKPVIAYGESLSATDYLVASGARELWLPPAGSIQVVGLRLEPFFLRGLLDQIGVKAEVLRVGSHKTAAEMLTRTGLSPEQREQLEALLDDWWEALVDGIARGRGKDPDAVRAWIDAGPHRAERAVADGFADACRQPDEAQDEIVARSPGAEEPDDVRVLDGLAYHALRAGNPGWRPPLQDLPRVAYVVAQGPIRRGHGLRGVASDVYRALLERLRRDPGVRGVVLRVASPGGDALASDLLWRGVRRLREEKPVVVSLGDVAASGGYYLAAAGDTILCEPATLTGSIGVVGGKLNLAGLYERLGVSRDALERGARAGLFTETRSFTPDERGAVREEMRAVYDRFVERVAEGRGLEREAVERRAQGRIYTGARAREAGLADGFGGPLEAVAEVRGRAGIAPDARILLEVLPRMPRLGSLRSALWAADALAGTGGLQAGDWP